jgi:hypothetical protein
MHRFTLSLGFALLLVLSIAIKVHGGAGGRLAAIYPGDEDIAALLHKNGFATHKADPNTDPTWTYGVRDHCKIEIADVSPQGWHRSAVEWQAAGQVVLYSAQGKLYNQQPILRPMITHYLRRLERYVGINAPQIRVRAIVIGPECSTDAIAPTELEALSQRAEGSN